jgi:hypothetical protein
VATRPIVVLRDGNAPTTAERRLCPFAGAAGMAADHKALPGFSSVAADSDL